jgi:hypothetical protein
MGWDELGWMASGLFGWDQRLGRTFVLTMSSFAFGSVFLVQRCVVCSYRYIDSG